MHDKTSQVFVFINTIFFLGILGSFTILKLITMSKIDFISFLHVKAQKSSTNASLLGGLAISFTSSLTVLLSLYYLSPYLSQNELLILKSSLVPIAIITFYGYLDDKHEIRARHKLFLQISSVISFLAPLSLVLFKGNFLALSGAFIFGLAYINGCNLIDGLDTIFAKIGIATSVAFLAISIDLMSLPSIIMSTSIIATLISFYYFNKVPAKIYTGEIGGSLLGLLFFVQAGMLIEKSITTLPNLSAADIISKVLIVSVYPLVELGITFSRRVFFKTSPFRGDHLHLHHIIKFKFNLNPDKASNIILATLIFTLITGFTFMSFSSNLVACLYSIATVSTIYSITCYRHWKKAYSKTSSNEIFFKLNDKPILVIDGKSIDLLYSELNKNPKNNSDDIAA